MRLDIFAPQSYDCCYVVFSDNTTLWWLRLLKPGFRHCYVLLKLKESGQWIELNPFSNQTAVFVYEYPKEFDFADYIRRSRKVIICPVDIKQAPLKCAPLSFFTCVEFVKRIIGMHDCFIHTPWQLYKKILKIVGKKS